MNKINKITRRAMTLALYTSTLILVNYIPALNFIAIPTMIAAIYAFGSKDIWGSLFIGTFGTVILRFIMGWPLAFHWSLANGIHPAVIALFAKKFSKLSNWLNLIMGTSIGSIVYPLASVITYVIYQSKILAIGTGFFYAGISILFSLPVIIIHPIVKNYFIKNLK